MRVKALPVLLALALGLGAPVALADTWTPAAGSLLQTPRDCPAPGNFRSCWSVPIDSTSPQLGPAPAWAQCVYWVNEMRPDVWNNRSATDPLTSWDAWTWVEHAQAEGLTVNDIPTPGSIAVWSPSAIGDSFGHVAYVILARESYGVWYVLVSEMNNFTADDPTAGQGDNQIYDLPLSTIGPGQVQFIQFPGYHAPAPAPVHRHTRRRKMPRTTKSPRLRD